ncbi:MAG: UDP-glucose 4-epimerase GalE [Polyangiales bacterium]
MTILVTGGAGYVGSHAVYALEEAGREVAVVDDLSAGRREAVPPSVPLLVADVADRPRVTAFLRERRVTAVLHFAARIQVGESVVDPRRYYVGNVAASVALLEACLDAGVNTFVLSSTAAVYGGAHPSPLTEDLAPAPSSPYGETKLAVERMLAAYAAAYGLRYAALRYFNAAGAAPERGLGERHEPETHLIPAALDVALGRRARLEVFGDDYPTPDGTCVRDYVHVLDLADAHLAAVDHLARGGEGGAFNLGAGVGRSVAEVAEAVRRVTGRPVPVAYGPRRPGDPAVLVASPAKAERVLGWRARRSSLERVVGDAWKFHERAFARSGARDTTPSHGAEHR